MFRSMFLCPYVAVTVELKNPKMGWVLRHSKHTSFPKRIDQNAIVPSERSRSKYIM